MDRPKAALETLVFETLTKLAPRAKTLLVAVSGGGDSVALLRLLADGPYQLEVAHVDHALREQSADDAQFVRALAQELGVPYHGVQLEVARIAQAKGWNLEDAARRLRYSFLTRTAKRSGADALLTAHTQDDQAETVLLQLLRGAAYATGIPARRGQVLRPLLGVSRRELRTYLETLAQPYREDENERRHRARAGVAPSRGVARLERALSRCQAEVGAVCRAATGPGGGAANSGRALLFCRRVGGHAAQPSTPGGATRGARDAVAPRRRPT